MNRISQLLFYAAVLVVTVTSLLPSEAFPKTEAGDRYQAIGHVVAYGLLALLGIVAHRSNRGRICVFLGLTALGILLELGQSFVPSRYGNLDDIAANVLGIAAVFLITEPAIRLRLRRNKQLS